MAGSTWKTGRRAPVTDDEWAECVRELTPLMRRVVSRIVREPADREDVLQGAWLRAWARAGAYAGDSTFSVWLYRVTFNHAISAWRDARRPSRYPGERAGTDAMLDAQPACGAIDDLAILRMLPDEARLMAEGYTLRESADRLGINLSAFKHRIYRWRRDEGAAAYDRIAERLCR